MVLDLTVSIVFRETELEHLEFKVQPPVVWTSLETANSKSRQGTPRANLKYFLSLERRRNFGKVQRRRKLNELTSFGMQNISWSQQFLTSSFLFAKITTILTFLGQLQKILDFWKIWRLRPENSWFSLVLVKSKG